MKNVTITLDEETAAWARVHAAEQGKSVSRLVGEMLRERMRSNRDYEEAMHRFLAKKPRILSLPDARYPKRQDLYDRDGLR